MTLKKVENLRDTYKYGFKDPEKFIFKTKKGLSEDTVRDISRIKNEPDWMLDFRLRAYQHFISRKMPTWGADLSKIDFNDIYYYGKPVEVQAKKWEDVPEDIRNTFDRLGIPEAEKKFLAGVGAQYESEVVYHNIRKDLEAKGVIFLDMDGGLREYPEIVKKYFSKIVPFTDNKFSALNTAVWSGGSFIYIPPGIRVEMPLQAYFRINAKNIGQFERTMIIADKGSYVHYVEGCTAPIYSTDSLHAAVVELVAMDNATIRYTTIQNWSTNVYNLVTKRAFAYSGARVEWIDGNLGCLAQGSTVTTPLGVKPIEKVKVGEKVLSFDESTGDLVFRKVIKKKFSGFQKVYEISMGERRLKVTPNHPFFSFIYDVKNPSKLGRYKLAYVRADKLKRAILPITSIEYGQPKKLEKLSTETVFETSNQYSNGLVAVRRFKSRLIAPISSNEEIMWFFGAYLGDGNIYRKEAKNKGTRYAKVGFSIPREDRARKKIIRILSDLIDCEPTERADKVHLTINSVELADFIELNGFKGTARTKRIPPWVLSTSENERLALLAGYLDTDGTIIKNKRIFSIKSVNKFLLEDVGKIATSLGISARIYTEYDNIQKRSVMGYECISHGSYRIEFHIDKRLFKYLSEKMKKEAENVEPAKKVYFRKIGRSSINLPESLQVAKISRGNLSEIEVPTWDIHVDETGNFISEGFIVHNSKITMKYPSVYLLGEKAHAEIVSIAFAGKGQYLDAGAKVIHIAPSTTSQITSKSVSKNSGKTIYRGLLDIEKGAKNVKSRVTCDALILDAKSASDTIPYMVIKEKDVTVAHEASVGRVSEEQLFYLMSRGYSEEAALAMIIRGFMDPFVRQLPMEYAIELNRLIELSMVGSVG